MTEHADACTHIKSKNLPNTLKIEVNSVHPVRDIVKNKTKTQKHYRFSFERRGQFWHTRSILDMNDGVSCFNRLTSMSYSVYSVQTW